jgi:hypothetical protein
MANVDSANLQPKKLTWRQPAAFAVATAISTVLAIYAVIIAPVEPVPGVSGLYIAAAVYVPLALWFGLWGCLAGYFSCLVLALYSGFSLPFALVWSLSDFFEGLVPLLIYRSLKLKPSINLKKPKITVGLNLLLGLDFAVAAFALITSSTALFLASFLVGIAVVVGQAFVEDLKTWLTWLVVGVLVASVMSAVFGVGTFVIFGSTSISQFLPVFSGWVLGDIVVLSTLGTIITVFLTPIIVKSGFYVRKYLL